MAETPDERLARLRREVEATWTPPNAATAGEPEPRAGQPPAPALPSPETVQPPEVDGPPDPAGAEAPPPVPAPRSSPPEPPLRPAAAATPPPRSMPPPAPAPSEGAVAGDDDWGLGEALGGAGLTQWVAIGLVVVGGYLLAAQLVPGLSFPGSLVMAAAGMVLLWLFFTHRHGAWALYAGAVLAAVGALRVIGGLLPFPVHGETALGVGIALGGIGYLRYSQAGGWGWQGIVGAAACLLGVVQLALGLLPGSPGLFDLVLPVLIVGAGIWLLVRTRQRAG